MYTVVVDGRCRCCCGAVIYTLDTLDTLSIRSRYACLFRCALEVPSMSPDVPSMCQRFANKLVRFVVPHRKSPMDEVKSRPFGVRLRPLEVVSFDYDFYDLYDFPYSHDPHDRIITPS